VPSPASHKPADRSPAALDPDAFHATLEEFFRAGEVEVYEDSRLLGAMTGTQFELILRAGHVVLHLWSEESNLVRRIVRVAEQEQDRLVLEVQKFGRGRPGKIELVRAAARRPARRLGREKFRAQFAQMLAEQFPDERVVSLTTAPDLEHSFSGSYTRGWMEHGQRTCAVLAAGPGEDAAAVDGILTYGLIWLDWAREHARRKVMQGLRLFLLEESGRITAHRLQALADWVRVELYEYSHDTWRVRRVDPRDRGNLATWLTPRREVEQTLAAAREVIEAARLLDPQAIDAVVPPGTREVALRYRGLEFLRWRNGRADFGLEGQRRELTPRNMGALRKLVERLRIYRVARTRDSNHALHRSQAERWLEHMVLAEPLRIDARLNPEVLYAQVPAFSGGGRGVIDLLGVTRDGRLVVMELKAAEDIRLVLQAVDYWLRVRWHHEQDDFQRYGYFTGVELQRKPPLLYLVAPGLRFHPATDTILKHLSPQIEVVRIGLNENWREGLQVIFRQ